MALEFYTDGSCSSDGVGGFGIVTVENDKVKYMDGKRCENTTSNREELKAVINVMLTYGCKPPLPPPKVYCDSIYTVNTFNQWMFDWSNNGWLKSDGKPPENLDLIKIYYDFYQKGYRIDLIKVKGHSGNKFNELADKIAKGENSDELFSKIK